MSGLDGSGTVLTVFAWRGGGLVIMESPSGAPYMHTLSLALSQTLTPQSGGGGRGGDADSLLRLEGGGCQP